MVDFAFAKLRQECFVDYKELIGAPKLVTAYRTAQSSQITGTSYPLFLFLR